MKAFLFTAGKGTRLAPLTQALPKPAIPLLNTPLIEYSLQLFRTVGVQQFAFNFHHLPREMKRCLLEVKAPEETYTFFDESKKILGSSGALPASSDWWGDDEYIFLGNGDECYLPDDPQIMTQVLEKTRSSGALAGLVVKEHPGVGSEFGGIWIDDQCVVRDIGKLQNSPYRGYHYTGYAVVHKRILDYVKPGEEQNIFYDTLLPLIHSQKETVIAISQSGFWSETGNPKGFYRTQSLLMNLIEAHDERIQFLLNRESRFEKTETYRAFLPRELSIANLNLEGDCCIHPETLFDGADSIKISNSILMNGVAVGVEFCDQIRLLTHSASITS